MAVQYVDITTLTEYTGDDLSGNEPIQVSASAFTTIGGITDFGEKKFGDRPTMLVLPNSLLNLTESSSSAAISNVINSVASGWNDFVSKVSSANLVYSRTNRSALNQYRVFISTITSNLTNTVTFMDVANNQLTLRIITYTASSSTYSFKLNVYSIPDIVNKIPKGEFKYIANTNTISGLKSGDYLLLVNASSKDITVNLSAANFNETNNHICKFCIPGDTETITVTTDNGIPPLMTYYAMNPIELGGVAGDRIVYTISVFGSHSNPSNSQIWLFLNAELYHLNA